MIDDNYYSRRFGYECYYNYMAINLLLLLAIDENVKAGEAFILNKFALGIFGAVYSNIEIFPVEFPSNFNGSID